MTPVLAPRYSFFPKVEITSEKLGKAALDFFAILSLSSMLLAATNIVYSVVPVNASTSLVIGIAISVSSIVIGVLIQTFQTESADPNTLLQKRREKRPQKPLATSEIKPHPVSTTYTLKKRPIPLKERNHRGEILNNDFVNASLQFIFTSEVLTAILYANLYHESGIRQDKPISRRTSYAELQTLFGKLEGTNPVQISEFPLDTTCFRSLLEITFPNVFNTKEQRIPSTFVYGPLNAIKYLLFFSAIRTKCPLQEIIELEEVGASSISAHDVLLPGDENAIQTAQELPPLIEVEIEAAFDLLSCIQGYFNQELSSHSQEVTLSTLSTLDSIHSKGLLIGKKSDRGPAFLYRKKRLRHVFDELPFIFLVAIHRPQTANTAILAKEPLLEFTADPSWSKKEEIVYYDLTAWITAKPPFEAYCKREDTWWRCAGMAIEKIDDITEVLARTEATIYLFEKKPLISKGAVETKEDT